MKKDHLQDIVRELEVMLMREICLQLLVGFAQRSSDTVCMQNKKYHPAAIEGLEVTSESRGR